MFQQGKGLGLEMTRQRRPDRQFRDLQRTAIPDTCHRRRIDHQRFRTWAGPEREVLDEGVFDDQRNRGAKIQRQGSVRIRRWRRRGATQFDIHTLGPELCNLNLGHCEAARPPIQDQAIRRHLQTGLVNVYAVQFQRADEATFDALDRHAFG